MRRSQDSLRDRIDLRFDREWRPLQYIDILETMGWSEQLLGV